MLSEMRREWCNKEGERFNGFTRNLWQQGPIPERWRERMPDNAEW